MRPYPLIFCPPGTARPACAPPGPAVDIHPAKGPDVAHLPEAERAEQAAGRGWGTCYGGPLIPDLRWQRTAAGWWIALDGFRPQDLLRLEPHPRVLRWRQVQGASADHWWSVPVILTPAGAAPDRGYVSALDRLLVGPGDRAASDDLAALQEPLLAIANGIPLAITEDERNAAIERLAIALLAIGHWVDSELVYTSRWLSETALERIIVAALNGDQTADVAPSAAVDDEGD